MGVRTHTCVLSFRSALMQRLAGRVTATERSQMVRRPRPRSKVPENFPETSGPSLHSFFALAAATTGKPQSKSLSCITSLHGEPARDRTGHICSCSLSVSNRSRSCNRDCKGRLLNLLLLTRLYSNRLLRSRT